MSKNKITIKLIGMVSGKEENLGKIAKNLSIQKNKENYKSICEIDILNYGLDASVVTVGSILNIYVEQKTGEKESLFLGPIVELEKINLDTINIKAYSIEWYLESSITSVYFEKSIYHIALSNFLKEYGIKLKYEQVEMSNEKEMSTEMFLKKSALEIINGLLENSSNKKYLYLAPSNVENNDVSNIVAKLCSVPSDLFKKKNVKNIEFKILKNELLNLTEEYSDLKSIVDLKNKLKVYNQEISEYTDVKEVESSKIYGELSDIFVGDIVKAQKELKELSEVKRKIKLVFRGTVYSIKPFDLIKFEKENFIGLDEVYEVSEIKRTLKTIDQSSIDSCFFSTEINLEYIGKDSKEQTISSIPIQLESVEITTL